MPALLCPEKTPAFLQIMMARSSFGQSPPRPLLLGRTDGKRAPPRRARDSPLNPFLPLFPGTCFMLQACSQHHTWWESKQGPGAPLPGKDQHVPCPLPVFVWGSFCSFWQGTRWQACPPCTGHLLVCARCWEMEHCSSFFTLSPFSSY